MRPTLLKSFLICLIFWFVATTLWWSLQRPEVNLASLSKLKALLPFLPFEVPSSPSILESLSVQKRVFVYWTIPVLVAAFLSGLSGYGLAWLQAKRVDKERKGREKGSGNYRGVELTLGVLPEPRAWPCDEINLGAGDEGVLSKMTPGEKAALEQVLGVISAHPDAYAGEGVSGSLLEYSLQVAEKALQSPRRPGLSAVVAVAHEMGKIVAYVKTPDGAWVKKKRQDVEGANILGTLPAWYALPAVDRSAVLMAVKYHSIPKSLPEPEGDANAQRLARELLSNVEESSSEVLVQEKQRTIEKAFSNPTVELPEAIFSAFLQALPQLSFQNRGLPKGVAAVAWKMGARVYLLEIKLRETVSAKLAPEIRGALTQNPGDRSRLQPFTAELLKALQTKGWLVTKIDNAKVDPREALWNVKAGKLDFKGVIVIDVPQEYLSQLPSDDSMYDIQVTGTLFNANQGMQVSKQDLMGSVLRPASEKRAQVVDASESV